MRRNDVGISALVERFEKGIEFEKIDQPDELGGKLNIQSAPSTGTTLRFSFPASAGTP